MGENGIGINCWLFARFCFGLLTKIRTSLTLRCAEQEKSNIGSIAGEPD